MKLFNRNILGTRRPLYLDVFSFSTKDAHGGDEQRREGNGSKMIELFHSACVSVL